MAGSRPTACFFDLRVELDSSAFVVSMQPHYKGQHRPNLGSRGHGAQAGAGTARAAFDNCQSNFTSHTHAHITDCQV